MTKEKSNDDEWLAWIEVQKQATKIWIEEDDQISAIQRIDLFLGQSPPIDLRRQAIGFRGSLYEDLNDLEAARKDYISALKLSEAQDYESYTLEVSAGVACEKLGKENEAVDWYLRSMETILNDPTTAVGSELMRLLNLRPESQLSTKEKQLIQEVVRQSWASLALDGEPDFGDLGAIARKLRGAKKNGAP